MQIPSATALPTATVALAEQLGELLRELFLDPDADHLGVIEQHELTLTQVRILLVLACAAEHQRRLQMSDLAERLGISNGAISRAFAGLVERGMATRHEASDDRRIKRVAIARPGAEVVDQIATLRTAGLSRFVERLDDLQRRLLAEALASIRDGGER